jgi:hypothetical protein
MVCYACCRSVTCKTHDCMVRAYAAASFPYTVKWPGSVSGVCCVLDQFGAANFSDEQCISLFASSRHASILVAACIGCACVRLFLVGGASLGPSELDGIFSRIL